MKIKWEDLLDTAENAPGLIAEPALLRHRLEQDGPMTLRELLQFLRSYPGTRQTAMLGPLPINETGIDRLDQALTAMNEAARELTKQIREARDREREAREELADMRLTRIPDGAQITVLATLDMVRQAVREELS